MVEVSLVGLSTKGWKKAFEIKFETTENRIRKMSKSWRQKTGARFIQSFFILGFPLDCSEFSISDNTADTEFLKVPGTEFRTVLHFGNHSIGPKSSM